MALLGVWLLFTHHGPFSSDRLGDLYVYDQYHFFIFEHGLVPFRDFEFEYPPGALIPIVIAGGDPDRMSLLMLACTVVCLLCAWEIGGWKAGWLTVAVPPVAGALVRTHFDLLPAAMAMVGLWLIVAPPNRKHMVESGFAVLALGTMTKLWPGAIAVVAFAWLLGRDERRLAVRSGVVFLAVIAVTAVPFVALGGFPSTMVKFHLQRPVQIESTAASVIEVVGGSYVTGDPIRHDRFKSNGLDGGAADVIGVLSTLALLAASVGLIALVARRPSRDALVIASLAIVVAFVAFGKVLSPQYVCWMLPLAAVAAVRGAPLGAALTALASLTTQLWFPNHYFDVVHQHDRWLVLVGVRNAILLLALAATARALARSPRRVAAAPRTG
ncbi:hypothetical protein DSM104299_05847 [Baekduia alba]|uniref:glycosyltransferase 87 family protein n=1 Tax=Baekduia alba TaxID=2997333 RepID=UPI00234055AF|nr:glycosyltransferase 87 family protein [Baekduia alba]WCB97075.1 hypothetical protein DSM104299_05847 [Baekduia alba]